MREVIYDERKHYPKEGFVVQFIVPKILTIVSTVGALKHIILPLCTFAHIFAIGVFLFKGKEFMATTLDWPRETTNLTPIERHLLGAGFTFHVVLTASDVVAIVMENVHYRGMATVLEFLLHSLDLANAVYENSFLDEKSKLFTLVSLASFRL